MYVVKSACMWASFITGSFPNECLCRKQRLLKNKLKSDNLKLTCVLFKLSSNCSNCLELRSTKDFFQGGVFHQ